MGAALIPYQRKEERTDMATLRHSSQLLAIAPYKISLTETCYNL